MGFEFGDDVGFLADRLGDGVAGDIVLGWAESSGEHDDIGTFPGGLDQLDQALPVVADLVHEVEIDAHRGQSPGDVVGVVSRIRPSDFGADADDFRAHVTLIPQCSAMVVRCACVGQMVGPLRHYVTPPPAGEV